MNAPVPSPAPMPVYPDDGLGLPPEFDPAEYAIWNEIARTMTPDEAWRHFRTVGWKQGRRAGPVHNRATFSSVIAPDARVLEIGPAHLPALKRPERNVAYLDVQDTAGLRRRAVLWGGDPDAVPEIDYVWTGQRYPELIAERFDAVFSAHNIEHQPDLVRHLVDLESILAPGGHVFLCVPDKRYTFDHFLPESTVADVLGAYVDGPVRHSARTVIEGLLHAHNTPQRHWAGDHGDNTLRAPPSTIATKLRQAVETYRSATDYQDAHAWKFTPASFRYLLDLLHQAGFIPLRPVRIYGTFREGVEFYAILTR